MIAVDTNVLLRILLKNDAKQFAAATKLLAERKVSTVRVSLIVLAELMWTLRRKLKIDKALMINAVETLLARVELEIENRAAVVTAIDWYRSGSAGFNDYLIAAANKEVGAMPTFTFDRHADRHSAFASVPA